MTFQQLRYLVAIRDHGLNMTAAARSLRTSQPGVSHQINLLEQELGLPLFERAGRALTRLTPAGEDIVDRAARIVREMQNIRRAGIDLSKMDGGILSVATTHTQARYVLPDVIRSFRARYPRVRLHLHQGTAEQIAELVSHNRVDLAIATGSSELFPRLVRLPIYRWRPTVVVPHGHPLEAVRRLTLKKLATHPIITYLFRSSDGSSLLSSLEAAGVPHEVALTADGADVIKTYVRLGLGVGVIAGHAIESGADADLSVLDAPRLFEEQTAWIGFRRRALVRGYMYDFIELLAPHLQQDLVREADSSGAQEEIDRLFGQIPIPARVDNRAFAAHPPPRERRA
ncbi:MAG: LysR substrate-binding domain-containing protein [Steroidobacteraceae bacterium]|jgi:LysR family cys regulon transcriptional activator